MQRNELKDKLNVLAAPEWTRLSWYQWLGDTIGAIIVLAGVDARFYHAMAELADFQKRFRSVPMVIVSGETTTNPIALERSYTPASKLAGMVDNVCDGLGLLYPVTFADVVGTNTHESAQQILPVLLANNVQRALLVMSPPHMLRALLTLRRWFDENGGRDIMLFTSVTKLNLENPQVAREAEEDVAAELWRIEKYSSWGHCYRRVRDATRANPTAWPSH